ncbi:RelE toxin [Salmonella enterica]|nr:RelE toxin [Salmonella enterica]
MTYKLAFNESALKEWKKLGHTIQEQFKKSYVNGLKTLGFRLLNYMEERISTKLSCVVQDTDWCTASKMKLSR